LKRLRERRGLTQEQLAGRIGAHRVTITKLETGALRPGVDVLEALAKALKVKVTDLLK
jgi:transcriptional regulator with XRE-family HTH domain